METPISTDDLLRAGLKHQDALRAYAFSILRDWNLADDAVQEALIAVNKKANTFNGTAIQPWIRGFVRLQALQIIRKRKRHSYVGDESMMDLIDARFDQHLSDHEADTLCDRKDALRVCMQQLPEPQAAMLLGFYRDALPCDALAELYDRSVNAVRLTLSRVRVHLRRCVSARTA